MILLVEDDAAVASMLMMVIKAWGLQVIHASTSREAVDFAALRQNEISLVVCDVNLQGESGPVVVDKIRAIIPRTKTLYTSGSPFENLCESGLLTPEALKIGYTGYLEKPFSPVSLKDAIDSLLLATPEGPLLAVQKGAGHAGAAY